MRGRTLLLLLAVAAGLLWTSAPGLSGSLPGTAGSGPAASAEWRERFLAGLAARQGGAWRTAADGFAASVAMTTPIAEYALYFQADSLARLGEARAASAAATQAVEKAADGPLAVSALLLAAQQASRHGDEASALELYRRFVDRFAHHPEAPLARLGLGRALEATGAPSEALRVYRLLWLVAPASPAAEGAARQERALGERGITLPAPTSRELVERAERLLAAGVTAPARVEAEGVLGQRPESDVALRALGVIVEAWRRAGRTDEALRAVDRALAAAPVERRPQWLLERARLEQSRNREAALAAVDRIEREFARSAEAPAALLLRAQVLEAMARPADVEATYGRLAARHPDTEEGATALWRMGWTAWFRREHQEAVQRWSRLLTVRGGDRYRDMAGYWIGRAHAERREAPAAERQFSGLVGSAPRSYYGLLAAARLGAERAIPVRDVARPALSLPADPLEPVRQEPRYVKAEALRSVGLGDMADAEMEDLTRRAAGEPARLFAVSSVYAQDARYHLSLRILRRDFVPLARSGHPALPRTFWEMFYPLGWRDDLASAATRASLDPLFVAAVVREESSFDPRARSRTGARGLMQLMPDTARPLARARGRSVEDGALDEPAVNLEIGSVYMSGLVKEFVDPRLAVAAYNAGPRRVREWWAARRSDDIEAWIEHIPFNETRGFVKRVMLSWEEYRRVYGGRP
jgi:soluble lytic murein transglycosylase